MRKTEMTMRLMLAFLVLLGTAAQAATPAAVIADPPPDKAHPAGMTVSKDFRGPYALLSVPK